MSEGLEIEECSVNIVADTGLPSPEERLANADLAIRIAEIIRARRLAQTRAAHVLKIDQPKISRPLRGQFSGFSTERLMHWCHSSVRPVPTWLRLPAAGRAGRPAHAKLSVPQSGIPVSSALADSPGCG